jgi:hypothetical protein
MIRVRAASKSFLSRRTMLRGASVALGLPILEAMLDSSGKLGGIAHAGGAVVPTRLLMMFVPNGLGNGGDEYSILPTIVNEGSLKPHQSDLLLLTELSKVDQYVDDTSGRGDAHATGHCTFGTGMGIVQGGAGGPSVDQYAASKLGGDTRFRSVVATLKPYPEAYFNAVSWTSAANPVPPRDDPAGLLEDLFADGTEMPTARDYRTSILDHVQADIQRLQKRVGAKDKARLDQHLSSVRDVENQISKVVNCDKPDAPGATDDLTNERARAMLDLMIIAFQCDVTRFGSFMLGNRANQRQYPWIGVVGGADSGGGYEEGHHGMSHDESDSGRERLRNIVTDEVAQLAYVMDRMKSIDEGAGSMLDNSIVFFGTEHATSATHNVYGMQAIVAGRGGGNVPVGQTKACGGTNWANSFVNILNWLGIPDTSFGDYGHGRLPGL